MEENNREDCQYQPLIYIAESVDNINSVGVPVEDWPRSVIG